MRVGPVSLIGIVILLCCLCVFFVMTRPQGHVTPVGADPMGHTMEIATVQDPSSTVSANSAEGRYSEPEGGTITNRSAAGTRHKEAIDQGVQQSPEKTIRGPSMNTPNQADIQGNIGRSTRKIEYEIVEELVQQYSSRIQTKSKEYATVDAILAMESVLKELAPYRIELSILERVAGVPSLTVGATNIYRFDTGEGGWEWHVQTREGVVIDVEKKGLD